MAFDPEAATRAYIDGLGAAVLEKSASYTAGSHWMLLWGLVVSALVTWLIVRWGVLDRVAQHFEKRGWVLRTWLIGTVFFLCAAFIGLPWTIYEEWGRNKSYGMTSQPLADFLTQNAVGTLISAVLGGLFFMGVYALMRRTGKRWWLWSGGFTALVGVATILLSPMLIEPIFNKYKPVPEGPVKAALIKMADDAQIPRDRIFVYDGSRQSNRFTANVSGIFGSARIAISDVALKQASLDEVKAVTGHEIGHYVLGHVWPQVALLAVLSIIGFFLADFLFPLFARWFGSAARINDPQGLPILTFMVSLFMLFAHPLQNAVIRTNERAADNHSLKTVNLPDALSGALVKTAEYRYPRPSALQEVLFYTHPSVEWRVRNAMVWKSTHPAP